MATNEILTFASTNTGTNLLTQSEYAADAQRIIGHQPGIARSKLENKALRQASLMASGLAEFIADYQANNVTDSLTSQNVADYLYSAIQSALAVTPPQFDNDTSLATTEFVQRALGNFTTTQQYSNQTATLTAAQVGRVIILSGGSNTITLPSTAACPTGSTFEFFSQGGAHTINAPAGHVLAVGAQNTGSQISVSGNDFFTVVNQAPNVWAVTAGTPMMVNAGVFRNLVASNGYQQFPSGIMLQWGTTGSINPGATATISLPITFPVAAYVVLGTWGLPSPNNAISAIHVNSIGQSSFVVQNTDMDSAAPIRWFAIGR